MLKVLSRRFGAILKDAICSLYDPAEEERMMQIEETPMRTKSEPVPVKVTALAPDATNEVGK